MIFTQTDGKDNKRKKNIWKRATLKHKKLSADNILDY